jgi:hypothetical protein
MSVLSKVGGKIAAVGSYLRRMSLETLGWLLFKITLGVGWASGMLFVTPESLSTVLSPGNVGLWAVGCMIGAIVSICGMLLILSKCWRTRRIGYTTELIGIVLFAGGPLQYFLIQLAYITTDFQSRYTIAWFSLAMLVVMLIRILIVAGTFVREVTEKGQK